MIQALGRVLPLCFPPPAILAVSRADVSYSSIERQMRQETLSLLAVALAPVSLALCALAGAIGKIPLLAQSTAGARPRHHPPVASRCLVSLLCDPRAERAAIRRYGGWILAS